MSQEFLDKLYRLHKQLTDAVDQARIDKKDKQYIDRLEELRISISDRAKTIRKEINSR